MRIKSLKDINFILKKNVIVSLITIIVCGLTVLIGVNHQLSVNRKQVEQEVIQSVLALYQSNISEKLGIIASSEAFINYIRSGPESRKNLRPQIISSIRHIDPNSIAGTGIIRTSNKEILFKDGKPTPYYITLELCYINRTLDKNVGNCEYQIELFFNKPNLIKALNHINHNIFERTNSGISIDFISDNLLGNFSVVSGGGFSINLDYINSQNKQLFFFVFILIAILALFAYWNKSSIENVFDNYIYLPLQNITTAIKNDEKLNDSDIPIEEINFLKNEIISWKKRLEDIKLKEKQTEISTLISKIVHDMRTPLAVIEAVSQRLSYDENTALIQKSVKVLKELGNNTLQLAKGTVLEDEKKIHSLPASLLLIDSISEIKQISKIDGIKLSLDIKNYGTPTSIPRSEFYRIISNVIENAADAINSKGNLDGEIQITLGESHHNFISITISDNGIGIDEKILSKVTQEGFTHGKKGGTGFGLFNTNSLLKKWGGDIKIESLKNKGTTITLLFPKPNDERQKYCNKIVLAKNAIIIILDDSISILELWKEKLSKFNVLCFNTVSEFKDNLNFMKNNDEIFYIIDYDLSDNLYTGIDLINEYNLEKKCILCTGRYEDEVVLNRCMECSIEVLPKELISHIPIEHQHINKAVLIDDVLLNHSCWQLLASGKDIDLTCFINVNDFMRNRVHFLPETPIYIDSELGDEVKGELEAEKIYNSGFTHIVLTTGYTHLDIKDYPWIRKIIGKEPQFV